ncbi:hypothetical protein [Brumimicrobium sp.]|uniref:hypothetical protein n=1 Tax=Brumimicrobium sp. TaxID=2029867 RepID=UPI003A93A49A
MKKISLIALLTLMMFVVSFQGKAQEASSVIIRITTSSSDRITSQILTVDPEGNTSTVPLKITDIKNYNEHLKQNTILIQKEINNWLSKGYKIVSSVSEMDRKIMIILTKE